MLSSDHREPQSQRIETALDATVSVSIPRLRNVEIFGLAVVSSDGFIARNSAELPSSWASGDDFAYLQQQLALGGACVMGRLTHELNPNVRGRQRVVCTRAVDSPKLVDQHTLMLNPEKMAPEELVRISSEHGGLPRVFVLGGTRIYDLFLQHVGFDRFDLSVESGVRLGAGLPLFTRSGGGDIELALQKSGLVESGHVLLNDRGLRVETFTNKRSS
jgi:dihydrofolate reductase